MKAERIYKNSRETEEYEESHPSYGMVGLSRVSVGGKGMALYGSAVKHGNAIRLSVQKSIKCHQLSRDWHSATEEIVEIYLSGNQLADMLSCMNVGDGVPCTISRLNGKTIPPCPEESPREEMERRVDAHMEKLAGRVTAMERELEEMLGKSGISRKKQEALRHQVLKIKQDVGTNMGYMKRTLNEYTDNMLTEAKGEFSAMVDSMIHSRGLEGLRSDGLIALDTDIKEVE